MAEVMPAVEAADSAESFAKAEPMVANLPFGREPDLELAGLKGPYLASST